MRWSDEGLEPEAEDFMAGDRRSERTWWAASYLAIGLAAARIIGEGHEHGIDTFRYLDAADAVLGDGSLSEQRYPPGYPTMLALTDLVGLPAWTTTTVCGLALIALIWWAAIRLAGPSAGAAAGVFCLASDLLGEAGVLLMSDTPAATFVIAGLVAGLHRRWILAGLLVAGSAWIRLPHAAFVVAAPRVRMAVAAVPLLVLLAVFNLIVFGGLSTYRSDQVSWSLDYLLTGHYLDNALTPWGNHEYYASVLTGRWGHLVPLLVVAAALELWHRRDDAATRFAAGVITLNVAMYLFYFYQSSRFVLPAAAVIVVYASAWTGRSTLAAIDAMSARRSVEREAVVPDRDAEEVHRP